MAVLKKEKKAAALKKYLFRKCNCCVKVVTLKKCEKSRGNEELAISLSKNTVVLKTSQHIQEGKSLFEKQTQKTKQIRLMITFNWNCLPERFPHPGKYSYEILH